MIAQEMNQTQPCLVVPEKTPQEDFSLGETVYYPCVPCVGSHIEVANDDRVYMGFVVKVLFRSHEVPVVFYSLDCEEVV